MRLLARIQGHLRPGNLIRTVFSIPTPEAMAGGIEGRFYENAAATSEFVAEELPQSNSVAEA